MRPVRFVACGPHVCGLYTSNGDRKDFLAKSLSTTTPKTGFSTTHRISGLLPGIPKAATIEVAYAPE